MPLLPPSNLISKTTTAITSRICIKPPDTLKANIPKSHPITRITTITYKIFPMIKFLCVYNN